MQAVAGFMADIAAAEIVSGGFAVTVFMAVAHPVAAEMGYRLLVLMTVDAVAGVMTDRAGAPVVAGFHAVTGILPAEIMIERFLGPMTFFTEGLAIIMTVGAAG